MEDFNNREEETGTQTGREERVSENQEEPRRKKGSQKTKRSVWTQPWLWILIIIIIAGGLVFGMGWVKLPSLSGTGEPSSGQESQKVVATVNGDKITRDQLSTKVMQTKQQIGTSTQATDKQIQKQALTSLINQTLIIQDAKKQGITVTDKEVNKSYQQIVNKFESKKKFEKELQSRELTKAELKENVRSQLLTQKYLQNNIDTKSITVTEKEITQAYNQRKSQRENIPPLEQVKQQIRQLLKSQKQKQMINGHIQKLRENADIQKNL